MHYTISEDGSHVRFTQQHIASGAVRYMNVPFTLDVEKARDIAQASFYVDPDTGEVSSPTWKDVAAYVPMEMGIVANQ